MELQSLQRGRGRIFQLTVWHYLIPCGVLTHARLTLRLHCPELQRTWSCTVQLGLIDPAPGARCYHTFSILADDPWVPV
jgi:hypothetical protein